MYAKHGSHAEAQPDLSRHIIQFGWAREDATSVFVPIAVAHVRPEVVQHRCTKTPVVTPNIDCEICGWLRIIAPWMCFRCTPTGL
ncbi:hypothetical protein R1flu_018825 [Riccia fluitans]|uniref:Uncharacterized protein n=1 Tax=Riccia fluitans TaxID=41844 RepID=A0ABD1ZH54_9MARC